MRCFVAKNDYVFILMRMPSQTEKSPSSGKGGADAGETSQ